VPRSQQLHAQRGQLRPQRFDFRLAAFQSACVRYRLKSVAMSSSLPRAILSAPGKSSAGADRGAPAALPAHRQHVRFQQCDRVTFGRWHEAQIGIELLGYNADIFERAQPCSSRSRLTTATGVRVVSAARRPMAKCCCSRSRPAAPRAHRAQFAPAGYCCCAPAHRPRCTARQRQAPAHSPVRAGGRGRLHECPVVDRTVTGRPASASLPALRGLSQSQIEPLRP